MKKILLVEICLCSQSTENIRTESNLDNYPCKCLNRYVKSEGFFVTLQCILLVITAVALDLRHFRLPEYDGLPCAIHAQPTKGLLTLLVMEEIQQLGGTLEICKTYGVMVLFCWEMASELHDI
ncbi:hypothetical protein CEXT_389621 [Caerostris extrusa]|uniref:Uncharacterized protein n=1 Tax=Caerostris extrusa TaxID=172846 RepID=A0AAV4U630_CAEEX|nr:hypothetical protein CEXT_389621 [Caerostris extrusa]